MFVSAWKYNKNIGSYLCQCEVQFQLNNGICNYRSSTSKIFKLFKMPIRKEDVTKQDVYCSGPLLEAVQMAHIFGTSKRFVDKKMKFSIADVLSNFYNLKKNYGGRSPAHEALRMFIEENFEDSHELEMWLPPDWHPNPQILSSIKDQRFQLWAGELNEVWKTLGRRMSDDVKLNPQAFSSIPLPNSFIVPAGKIKEMPYWDSFFIILGLLSCDMPITAKDMIKNMLYLIENFGYVLHSSRIYYEGRSHPPMLPIIMDLYFRNTFDFDFIKESIEIIEKELIHWKKNKTVIVNYEGMEYEMYYYNNISEGPRPEAFRDDMSSGTLANSREELQDHFTCIKAASESGWAFSTRWFVVHGFNHGSRSNTRTPDIIPVDLNAIMHRNFCLLQKWYKRMGDQHKSKEYWVKAEELCSAINTVLWNERINIWKDYDFRNQKLRNYFYLSNFMPLFTRSYKHRPNEMTQMILNYLNKYNMDRYDGGLPASTEYSGELWDFPNALPPLQYFLITGLDLIGTATASELAFHFADKFINACYKGYYEHGTMFGAYDCLMPGRFGIGLEDIEYGCEIGEGYGWTNGVILSLLRRFGNDLRVIDEKAGTEMTNSS
ncbi:unnamed protein product [Nezara viridula]|uniref:Trehalase n=1 Tax=Nezara viridula TaxID=85310 RepID=A0A9P0GYW0_NEZVI|nr:unnamed protein product [Nezara viridula]